MELDQTGLHYKIMKEIPPNYPPYLAGTSNNSDLAQAMCIYLCKQNPKCLAWIENVSNPCKITESSKRYWANKVKQGQV